MQPNDVSNHTLVKVNLGIAAICLIAMLGMETKCLWRLWRCWRVKQIWYAFVSTQYPA